MELISDRVAIVHDLLFEGDEVEALLDDINAVLRPDYDDEAFENLVDATKELLDQFLDYVEEEVDEVADKEDFEDENELIDVDDESISALDREILIAEREEEDISDLTEEIIE